jgi:hypothetical protein
MVQRNAVAHNGIEQALKNLGGARKGIADPVSYTQNNTGHLARTMRRYLMRNGHIGAIEPLDVDSDEKAVEKCRAIFEERRSKFEGFEVWDHTRKVAAHPRKDDGYAEG